MYFVPMNNNSSHLKKRVIPQYYAPQQQKNRDSILSFRLQISFTASTLLTVKNKNTLPCVCGIQCIRGQFEDLGDSLVLPQKSTVKNPSNSYKYSTL
ncbi:hypothetical protein CEXT_92471 [Caerostris extrusa]|uniref:Uncharacterized protein n=1 Tax=Caerostris extrusa TaxID=172846 RepID=A0AAV4RFQ3_CAEEX|nr:hypothetical protein CEXT_92471 [Caerostris extrusa]